MPFIPTHKDKVSHPEWKSQQITNESTSSAPSHHSQKKVTADSLIWNKNQKFTVHGGEKQVDIESYDITERRFQNVKYRIYTFVLICLIAVMYSPFKKASTTLLEKQNQINSINQTITTRINDHHEYSEITSFLSQIEDDKLEIINCLNENQWCENLSSQILDNQEIIKWYLQIGSLQRDKMDINEAKVLRNINEFMVKSAYSTPERTIYNGNITNIQIWEKKQLNDNIIQVPLHLIITFNNQTNLVEFLENIENKVFYDEVNGLNYSILYKIQQIDYDIVNYDETQDVDIMLYAYAYNE